MNIYLIKAPTKEEWEDVKLRAIVTMRKKKVVNPPDSEWKHDILEARHSPIRKLMYSFFIEDIPSWISVHLVRHHAGFQPYVASQRNDRQKEYDRNKAPQDTPVNMIIDVNAEALMTLANKRLCNQAARETRDVVKAMCILAEKHTPEFKGLLVPMCEYHNGICHEMKPCGLHEKKAIL